MSNITGDFLGYEGARREAQATLDDSHGLWGGKRITLRGDGSAFITVVDLEQGEETFRLDVGPEYVLRVFAACEAHDILSIEAKESDRAPEESRTTLTLTNAAGKVRSVTQWLCDAPDPGFEAVRELFTELYENMNLFEPQVVARANASPAALAPVPQQRSPERVLDAIRAFLESDSWKFEQTASRPLLRLPFQGKNGKWMCFAQARTTADVEQLLFYSVLPLLVPGDKRPEVSEFIARANYGMAIGNFEIDLNDGEVRYKTSVDVTNVELDPGMIKPIIYTNVLMMDRYLPGFMAVVYEDVPPAEAVAQIEG